MEWVHVFYLGMQHALYKTIFQMLTVETDVGLLELKKPATQNRAIVCWNFPISTFSGGRCDPLNACFDLGSYSMQVLSTCLSGHVKILARNVNL